jgi:PGF-pre-PGF domain-containing protein
MHKKKNVHKESMYVLVAVTIVALVASIVMIVNYTRTQDSNSISVVDVNSNTAQYGNAIAGAQSFGTQDADTIAPSSSIVSPAHGANILAGQIASFVCSGSDDVGLSRVEFWINDPATGFKIVETRQLGGVTSTTQTFTKAFPTASTSWFAWNCKYYDTSGNSAWVYTLDGSSPGFHIVEDTVAPTITLTSPTSGAQVNTGQSVDFVCTVSDNAAIDHVDFWLNEPGLGSHFVESKPMASVPSGSVTFSKSFTVAGSTYSWTCKAVDPSGNSAWGVVNGYQSGFTVASDSAKPTTAIVSPTPGTDVLVNTPTDFTCSGSDNVGLSRVEFWITDPSTGFYLADTKQLAGVASTTQTFTKTFTNVANNYAWNCKYYDTAGNSQWLYTSSGGSPGFNVVTSINSNIDSIKPSVTLESPSSGSSVAPSQVANFVCSGSDNVGLSKVEFWMNEPGIGNHVVESRNLNGESSTTQTFSKTFTSTGSGYSWTCKYTDTSGNSEWGVINGYQAAFTIIADTTKPTTSIVSPAAGSSFTPGQTVSFTCSGSDNVGLSRVEFWITDPSTGFYLADTKQLAGVASTTQTFTKTFTSTGNNYAWNCKYFDTSGNSQWVYTGSGTSPGFMIIASAPDTTQPVVSFSAPQLGQIFNVGQSVSMTCGATDDGGLARVNLGVVNTNTGERITDYRYLNGVKETAQTFTKTFTTPGTYAWSCSFYDTSSNLKPTLYSTPTQSSLVPYFVVVQPPPDSCTDSDDQNIFNSGSVVVYTNGVKKTDSDVCMNATYVREYSCIENTTQDTFNDVECPPGDECSAGACHAKADACTDTDPANNKDVFGAVYGYYNGNSFNIGDTCDGSTTVIEAACKTDNTIVKCVDRTASSGGQTCTQTKTENYQSVRLACDAGKVCVSGACVNPDEVCTDSDGTNTATQGSAQGFTKDGGPFILTDACQGTVVKEYICNGTHVNSTTIVCPSGQTCSAGTCIAVNNVPPPTGGHGGSSVRYYFEKTFSVARNILLMNNYDVNIHIKSLEIYVKNSYNSVYIKVYQYHGDEPSYISSLDTLAKKYQSFTIQHDNLPDAGISKVLITYSVDKDWITQNNVQASDMKLYRYTNGVWTELETKNRTSDSSTETYIAESPGLSVFAIGARKYSTVTVPTTTDVAINTTQVPDISEFEVVTDQPEVVETPETSDSSTPETTGSSFPEYLKILFIAVGVIAIAGLAVFIAKRYREQDDDKPSEAEKGLEKWISEAEGRGYNADQLKIFLLSKGYKAKDIEEAVKRAKPKK